MLLWEMGESPPGAASFVAVVAAAQVSYAADTAAASTTKNPAAGVATVQTPRAAAARCPNTNSNRTLLLPTGSRGPL